MIKSKMRTDKKTLNLRAMGISNWVLDREKKELYSVQFYDYDGKDIPTDIFERIMQIFPYDCLLYETKHGTHFISFSLLHGLRYTKAKVIKCSKDLMTQDYWTEAKDLTLRVSAKWKKHHRIVSEKPKFKGIVKCATTHIISERHLEFYFNYMDLPIEIYSLYNDCDKRDYRIKIYHYKTRD